MGENTLDGITVHQYEQFINPSMVRLFRFMGLTAAAREATGNYVIDSNGKQYIDCLGGYGVFSLGHRHPKVIEVVKKQLDSMPMSCKILLDTATGALAAKLAEITPGDLQYSFFANSGAEAVEGALKTAKVHTRREKIIAATNSFHGKTMGALSATGRDIFRDPFQPLLPGFFHVPFGDVDAMEQVIDQKTAAVILEPIQGEGGIILPPDSYLPSVRELCDKNGAVLILDEVQTGIGRTGCMFACEHWGVVPDIITMAKALGGGVMPIGAFTARPHIWDTYLDAPFLHTSTFGGNPLAAAAALAAIEVTLEDNLCHRAATHGSYFIERLNKLAHDFPDVIVQVRGKGLMIGLELAQEGIGGLLMSELIRQGVLVAYTLNNPKVIRMEPPLIIGKNEINQVLECLTNATQTAYEVLDEL